MGLQVDRERDRLKLLDRQAQHPSHAVAVELRVCEKAIETPGPFGHSGDRAAAVGVRESTTNPLIGKNVEELGTRFPDMSEPYNKELIAKALEIGEKHNIKLHQGVYTAVTGPTFETHAEYRLIKVIGSDVVGMSTVQECIAAVHCGMKVFAVSVVTDLGIREDDNVITHEEVLEAAKGAEPKLTTLFTELAKIVG